MIWNRLWSLGIWGMIIISSFVLFFMIGNNNSILVVSSFAVLVGGGFVGSSVHRRQAAAERHNSANANNSFDNHKNKISNQKLIRNKQGHQQKSSTAAFVVSRRDVFETTAAVAGSAIMWTAATTPVHAETTAKMNTTATATGVQPPVPAASPEKSKEAVGTTNQSQADKKENVKSKPVQGNISRTSSASSLSSTETERKVSPSSSATSKPKSSSSSSTTVSSSKNNMKNAPANPGDVKNCGDFASYKDAKEWFDTYYPYYGDVAKLDSNNDGIPCESLPGAPAKKK